MWVESSLACGSIYVGDGNTADGFSNETDRTAQLSWPPDGNLAYANSGGVITPVVAGYATNSWMNIRLMIDTQARNDDLYYGVKGGAQTRVGDELPFRARTPSAGWNYDRLSFVLFGPTSPNVSSYLDDAVVTTTLCAADLNGYVDDSDFVLFAAAYNTFVCP